jgi:uncharacterized protein (TIGR02217 family)
MDFIETQFPPYIQYGASGGPKFQTDIINVPSSHERRDQDWTQSRGPWTVGMVRTRAQLDIVSAFFRVMRGQAYGFRFKDWSDYSATLENIGTGDGSDTTFQLRKAYTSGTQTYYRNIFKPVSGTIKIYLEGVEQVSGWSIDTTTGIVTFSTAPGVGVAITASYQFDIKARFGTDFLDITIQSNNIFNINGLSIVELQ